MLRTHCQTSGVSLQEQDPYNNVVRTTIEALAAVLGGTQSLHTNAFDEAIALPTPFSARIARNTQIIIAEESQVTRTVDPLAGSYYVESLTHSIVTEARKLIAEVEQLGGMTRAVIAGMPKQRIEETAARRQARIERGEEVIVGVNRYAPELDDSQVDVLEIDNTRVREGQIRLLREIRAKRDEAGTLLALDKLTEAARTGTGNLLQLSVEASRRRATVGEMSGALEKVWSRHRAVARITKGVYAEAHRNGADYQQVANEVKVFTEFEGRPPGILVIKMGQDGHDRGAKVIVNAFADLGFEVRAGELFQTPAEAAIDASECNPHVVGVSTLAGGHKTLVPQLIQELKLLGKEDVIVVCGGVIPRQDYAFLKEAGVAAIYGPGTNIPKAAGDILKLIPGRNR